MILILNLVVSSLFLRNRIVHSSLSRFGLHTLANRVMCSGCLLGVLDVGLFGVVIGGMLDGFALPFVVLFVVLLLSICWFLLLLVAQWGSIVSCSVFRFVGLWLCSCFVWRCLCW